MAPQVNQQPSLRSEDLHTVLHRIGDPDVTISIDRDAAELLEVDVGDELVMVAR